MNIRAFYRNRRVLVTGNTGFKGAWLSTWLKRLGAEVMGVSQDVPTQPSAFELLGGEKQTPTRWVDIRDGDPLGQVFREFKPDLVFHLAAQSLVRRSYNDPVTTWDTNVMGTVQVLECVRRSSQVAGCAVISSDKCYENLETGQAYVEGDRLGGKDPYSASKAGTELVFRSYAESFFSQGARALVSCRAGNVIGGGDWAEDRLVPDAIRALRMGRSLEIRSPRATRPWQHVLEPVGGYLLALAHASSDPKKWGGQSFNFGPETTNTRSVSDLLAALKKEIPALGWTERHDPSAPKEAGYLSVSSEKAHQWMGWRPSLSFEDTIAWTAQGYADDTGFAKRVEAQIAEFEKRANLMGWFKT